MGRASGPARDQRLRASRPPTARSGSCSSSTRAPRPRSARQTTRGRVVGRELAHVSGLSPEGRWGKGGNYRPKVTFTYRVDGVDYTSDRSTYATRGVRQSLAEQQLAATPDEVTVFYDPDKPAEAYLELHTPRLGHVLVAGGIAGVVIGLLAILAAAA